MPISHGSTARRVVSAAGLDEFSIDSYGREQCVSRSAIFERAEEQIEQCDDSTLLYPSVCCSSFLGNLTDTIAALAEFCTKRNVLFQMHSNEHFPEVHDCILRFGKRPIELFADIGALGPWTLLHHATVTTDIEIEHLRTSRTAVSYNPVASHWKGNAVAPALAYVARDVRMGIGSDNTRADGFRALGRGGKLPARGACHAGERFFVRRRLDVGRCRDTRLGRCLRTGARVRFAGRGTGSRFSGSRHGAPGNATVLGFRVGARPLLQLRPD
jgi:cytosine/adenosine deaminase-related metal-dependent hydrolase